MLVIRQGAQYMRIMMLGCPGVGKGTQAQFLCTHFSIPQISTGDILRAAIKNETALGLLAKEYIDTGSLVPDDVIIDVVKERLSQADCEKGFLLDGFPRTIAQADSLKNSGVNLDCVIRIYLDNEVIVSRLSGRRVHSASGRTYHVKFDPPKVSGIDDATGEPLIQRKDDEESVIRHRLKVYNNQTSPLINFYQKQAEQGDIQFIDILGDGDVNAVKTTIFKALNENVVSDAS
jgi:adenylate kinase